jgi:serine/threonine-protein kinase
MGSYLLILAAEGFHPVRCPVFVGRCADESAEVTLYRDGEIPAGFVQVPGGKFAYQGDRGNPNSGPREDQAPDDFFMARFPASCGEYLEFLNDLATPDSPDGASRQADQPDWKRQLGSAEKRVPRESESGGYYWPPVPGREDAGSPGAGRYVVPTAAWLAQAPQDLREKARRLLNCTIDWEEDWPAFSVSWEDAVAYAAWLARTKGLPVSLPHEVEWEKAARGVDGRVYPWGSSFDATFCNNNKSHEGGMRPARLDSFPADESPYGVRGLAGNASDACLNDPGENYPGWRVFRGGIFSDSGLSLRAAFRHGHTTHSVDFYSGFRLCLRPRPSGPKRPPPA